MRLNLPALCSASISHLHNGGGGCDFWKKKSCCWDPGETIAQRGLLGTCEFKQQQPNTVPFSWFIAQPITFKEKVELFSPPPTGLFQCVSTHRGLLMEWGIILTHIWPIGSKPKEAGIKTKLSIERFGLCLFPAASCFVRFSPSFRLICSETAIYASQDVRPQTL